MQCVNSINQQLNNLSEVAAIKEQLNSKNTNIQISGLVDTGLVNMMNVFGQDFKHKIIITFSNLRAKEIYDDMKVYADNPILYPAKDFIFYSADVNGSLTLTERLKVIKALANNENVTLVTTIDSFFDKLMPLNKILDNCFTLDSDSIVNLEALTKKLTLLGYERVAEVDSHGQFAVRGSIIDIFNLTDDVPVRIDLWDDEIDSIRLFDPESQRTIENISSVTILPATEYLLSSEELSKGFEKIKKDCDKYEKKFRDEMLTEEAHRLKTTTREFLESLEYSRHSVSLDSYIDYFLDEKVSLADYFDQNETLFIFDETNRCIEHANAVITEFKESMMHRLEKGYILSKQANVLWDHKKILAKLSGMKVLHFTTLITKIKSFDIDENYNISMKNVNPYNNSMEMLVKDLKSYKKKDYRIVILSGSKTRGARLADSLYNEMELPAIYNDNENKELVPGEIVVSYGSIKKGYEFPDIKLIVINESDIFTEKKTKKHKREKYSGQKISSFAQLNIGDYVVHENHGLGRYQGIEKIVVDKITKDYIKVEYASGGNLYIPAMQLDMIQKYAGADSKPPKLNKLGTQEWNKTKSKVKSAVNEIAKDLVELYAKRQSKRGFKFQPDTVWQKEFEESFPFEETKDQIMAIEDTKNDMESDKIMDRLICGDVGFGKTEVAIRAAFKAISDGKQVAFLVPTTILAQQHYSNFKQRMKDFPVTIELMSRFKTAAANKKTIENLKKGFVDIVIGTHRLLSKDIEYKDLGLLIIDEEQRFGVAHKEAIKKLKDTVDVLTLTATPIPRTLHMSLIGIRDMSVLEEAPVDRIPIQTYVMEYNDEIIREAINRELSRNGQVYYVYNKVQSIDEITARIQALVPEANVAYAHGQMSERKLEQIMYDFINGDIDVLVSTTIIETGLDIANANTMIIHDSDQLGLSSLYQLRGRIGRSNRTSYAFLMYRRDKMLKEVAEKRLQAIREFTDLGSGFKIAMRDLEIRGAGNILGEMQHGHMSAVGYDLYCKLLNEAVLRLKGEGEKVSDYDTSLDIDIDAYIPATYIKNEMQKLDIYKRIAGIDTVDEYEDMQDELIDRFGDIPKVTEHLLLVSLLKSAAHKAYITEITGNKNSLKFIMYNKAPVDTNKLNSLLSKHRNKLKFTADINPYFTYMPNAGTPNKAISDTKVFIELLTDIVNDIGELTV